MVPSSTTTLLIFLLVVVPGTAFELLWHRSRPRRDETAFIEVSRVILTGISFSGAALGTLVLAEAIAAGAAVDLVALLRGGKGYTARHPGETLRTLAAMPALSVLYAVAAHAVLTPPARLRRIAQESAWHTAFGRLAGPGVRAYVSVQLKNGMTVTGYIGGYSTDPDPAKRDLLLVAPLTVRAAGSAQTASLERGWQSLLVPGLEISTIATSYVGQPPRTPVRAVRGAAFTRFAWLAWALRWPSRYGWQPPLAGAAAIVLLLIVFAGP